MWTQPCRPPPPPGQCCLQMVIIQHCTTPPHGKCCSLVDTTLYCRSQTLVSTTSRLTQPGTASLWATLPFGGHNPILQPLHPPRAVLPPCGHHLVLCTPYPLGSASHCSTQLSTAPHDSPGSTAYWWTQTGTVPSPSGLCCPLVDINQYCSPPPPGQCSQLVNTIQYFTSHWGVLLPSGHNLVLQHPTTPAVLPPGGHNPILQPLQIPISAASWLTQRGSALTPFCEQRCSLVDTAQYCTHTLLHPHKAILPLGWHNPVLQPLISPRKCCPLQDTS